MRQPAVIFANFEFFNSLRDKFRRYTTINDFSPADLQKKSITIKYRNLNYSDAEAVEQNLLSKIDNAIEEENVDQ